MASGLYYGGDRYYGPICETAEEARERARGVPYLNPNSIIVSPVTSAPVTKESGQ